MVKGVGPLLGRGVPLNPRKECLFIGDDFENDFYAPRQIGTGLTNVLFITTGIINRIKNLGNRYQPYYSSKKISGPNNLKSFDFKQNDTE